MEELQEFYEDEITVPCERELPSLDDVLDVEAEAARYQRAVVEKLEPLEQQIIIALYGFRDREPMSYEDAAGYFAVKVDELYRMERKALTKLQAAMWEIEQQVELNQFELLRAIFDGTHTDEAVA